MKLRVGVLGAGGIGKFHAREFFNLECEVVGILGSSKESSIRTAKMIKEKFGIEAKPHYDLGELVKDSIDAVSICTPPGLHEQHITRCLDYGLHVLCEKPFVFSSWDQNYNISKALVEKAKEKGRVLTVNTQWASVLDQLGRVMRTDVKRFSVYMEPGVKGKNMLLDHLPHTNSMVIRMVGPGKARNIEFPMKEEDYLVVRFNYVGEREDCEVKYELRHKPSRPRSVFFEINGQKYERIIEEGYTQSIVFDGAKIALEDPLTDSVRSFVNAVKRIGKALISGEEILNNVQMQDQIIRNY